MRKKIPFDLERAKRGDKVWCEACVYVKFICMGSSGLPVFEFKYRDHNDRFRYDSWNIDGIDNKVEGLFTLYMEEEEQEEKKYICFDDHELENLFSLEEAKRYAIIHNEKIYELKKFDIK